jgi:hypothetical protein
MTENYFTTLTRFGFYQKPIGFHNQTKPVVSECSMKKSAAFWLFVQSRASGDFNT